MSLIYLFLNVFTIAYPAYAWRDSRIKYNEKWKELGLAIFFNGCLFISWDYYFTKAGIWRFNENYTLGIKFFMLPLEEWLFFLTVPFSCVFIYEVVIYFFRGLNLNNALGIVSVGLAFLLLLTAMLNLDKLYTSVTCILGSSFLLLHLFYFGTRLLTLFYITYFLHLIPFFLVNGVLTALPVVEYNNAENSGIRLGSIPIEDSLYSFLMLLILVSLYEVFKTRFKTNVSL